MVRFPSLLLFLSQQTQTATAQTFIQVCGADYNQALTRCSTGPLCPLGNAETECPVDARTCFNIPESSCIDPPTISPAPTLTMPPSETLTDAPSVTVMPSNKPSRGPLFVCGATREEAIASCNTNVPCPGGDMSVCPLATACFSFEAALCPTPEPTDGPSGSPTPKPPLRVCGTVYEEAVTNCNTNQLCPSGDGCAVGECFNVPHADCRTNGPSASPIVALPTTLAPSTSPVVKVPSQSPVPQFVYVCGSDSTDAALNCRTNVQCPNLDGCPVGTACFAIDYATCPEVVPTESPTVSINGMTGTSSTGVVDLAPEMPTMTTSANIPGVSTTMAASVPATLAPVRSPTNFPLSPPSKSPTYNTYFCGTDYIDAEENCATNQPCPELSGCPDGTDCYIISGDRCYTKAPTGSPTGAGPQPTSSPTSSTSPSGIPTMTMAPSAPGTDEPTAAPVVNDLFCGATYGEAVDNCSPETACPTGFGCPGGMNCFTGIVCVAPTPTPPTTIATTPATPSTTPGTTPAATTPATTAMTATTPATTPVTTTAGVPGVTTAPSAVSGVAGTSYSPSAKVTNATVSTPAPTAAQGPTFDPLATQYCGPDWTTALNDCYYQTPCPTGAPAECPNEGDTCFTGVICSAPPMTTTAATTTATTTGVPPVTTPSTTVMTTPATTPATPPTVGGVTNAPIAGTSVSPTAAHVRFCGSSLQDAQTNCAVNPPCPDGENTNCMTGQACFLTGTCAALTTGTGTTPAPVSSGTLPGTPTLVPTISRQPSQSPSDTKPSFDPDETQYCGVDYNDAQDNCYMQTPCPNGNADCTGGQTCYPISRCTLPPSPAPTTAMPTFNFQGGGLIPSVNGTGSGTGGSLAPSTSSAAVTQSTPQPTWSWNVGGDDDSGSRMVMDGSFAKLFVALSGVMFGWITLMI